MEKSHLSCSCILGILDELLIHTCTLKQKQLKVIYKPHTLPRICTKYELNLMASQSCKISLIISSWFFADWLNLVSSHLGADHLTLEGGGGWFLVIKNFFFLAIWWAGYFPFFPSAFYYISAACNFFLPTSACRKVFFKITHPPPQELNGRPLSKPSF